VPRIRSALTLVVLSCSTGCTLHPKTNSNCQWTSTQGNRSLYYDAEIAEDLAIRYADAHRGLNSRNFEGLPQYARARDQCMSQLFEAVANQHSVTPAEVRRALNDRPRRIDLAIALPFIALYIFAVNAIISRLYEKNLDGTPSLRSPVIAGYISLVTSSAGVLLGEAWTGILETFRLGNGHLSYRTGRLAWSHHFPALFVGGLVLFWCIVVIRKRAALRWRFSSSRVA
jgi:hypothetical protein